MITEIFSPDTVRGVATINLFYYISCLGCTLALLLLLRNSMPCDQGRAFAVNGELSKGKTRGVGLLFVLGFTIPTFLFVKISWELAILLVLFIIASYLFTDTMSPILDRILYTREELRLMGK